MRPDPRICKALHYITRIDATAQAGDQENEQSCQHEVIRCAIKVYRGAKWISQIFGSKWPNLFWKWQKFIFTVLLVFNSPSKTQDKKFFIKKKFYPKINLGNNQSIKILSMNIFFLSMQKYFYFIQYFGLIFGHL